MRIVINKCYGGFGISIEALVELVKRNAACLKAYTPKHYYGGDNENFKGRDWEAAWKSDLAEYKEVDGLLAHPRDYNVYKDGLLWLFERGDDGARADKDLIEIVERLGDKAFGDFADLKIVEIPDDVDWEIDEYDGLETIHEKHRSW